MNNSMSDPIAATRHWLEAAVIGLNLCPFAKAAYLTQRVHIAVTEAKSPEGLLTALAEELQALVAMEPEERETTLLVLPDALEDFLDYNDFLELADALLEDMDLVGEIQIASFHPQYRFAGTTLHAIENFTNRSPFPMLHLLREESVARAADGYPDVEGIPERNIATLKKLGLSGWQALMAAKPAK